MKATPSEYLIQCISYDEYSYMQYNNFDLELVKAFYLHVPHLYFNSVYDFILTNIITELYIKSFLILYICFWGIINVLTSMKVDLCFQFCYADML